jgi:hypothetical protein
VKIAREETEEWTFQNLYNEAERQEILWRMKRPQGQKIRVKLGIDRFSAAWRLENQIVTEAEHAAALAWSERMGQANG